VAVIIIIIKQQPEHQQDQTSFIQVKDQQQFYQVKDQEDSRRGVPPMSGACLNK